MKTLLSIARRVAFGGNKIAAAVSVQVHDLILPFMPAIYLWEYKFGYWAMHGHLPQRISFRTLLRSANTSIGRCFSPSAVRCSSAPVIIGLPSAAIVYFVCRGLVTEPSGEAAAQNRSARKFPSATARELHHLKVVATGCVFEEGGGVTFKLMKSFSVIASCLLLCSCADMVVTRTLHFRTRRSRTEVDAKDFGSKESVRYATNCGVGAANPSAIYIRPFCIDGAVFAGTMRRFRR